MNYQQDLSRRLKKLSRIFDFDQVLSAETTTEQIARYYRVNKWSYNLFHSRSGFVHMGLSRSERFQSTDLEEAALIVDRQITAIMAKKVLELAAGRGANSTYLAKRHPELSFIGLDLANGQLDLATKAAKGLSNFETVEGDYHDLSDFENDSIDIIFIVEALCHTNRKSEVLAESYRILRSGGRMIIIDAYANRLEDKLSDEEKLAKALTEKGMVLPPLTYYQDFIDLVTTQGFKVLEEVDESLRVMPSLLRLQKVADRFMLLPWHLLKLMVILLPSEFTCNGISGYLLPLIIYLDIASYKVVVFKK